MNAGLDVVYLDASVLVALLTEDALSHRAAALLANRLPVLVVSDFAGAEFASAMARRVRMGELGEAAAREALANFDAWTRRVAQRVELAPADVALATVFLRRLDLALRTPDALHIAIAQRLGAVLATFDESMATCARVLGTTVI